MLLLLLLESLQHLLLLVFLEKHLGEGAAGRECLLREEAAAADIVDGCLCE